MLEKSVIHVTLHHQALSSSFESILACFPSLLPWLVQSLYTSCPWIFILVIGRFWVVSAICLVSLEISVLVFTGLRVIIFDVGELFWVTLIRHIDFGVVILLGCASISWDTDLNGRWNYLLLWKSLWWPGNLNRACFLIWVIDISEIIVVIWVHSGGLVSDVPLLRTSPCNLICTLWLCWSNVRTFLLLWVCACFLFRRWWLVVNFHARSLKYK